MVVTMVSGCQPQPVNRAGGLRGDSGGDERRDPTRQGQVRAPTRERAGCGGAPLVLLAPQRSAARSLLAVTAPGMRRPSGSDQLNAAMCAAEPTLPRA